MYKINIFLRDLWSFHCIYFFQTRTFVILQLHNQQPITRKRYHKHKYMANLHSSQFFRSESFRSSKSRFPSAFSSDESPQKHLPFFQVRQLLPKSWHLDEKLTAGRLKWHFFLLIRKCFSTNWVIAKYFIISDSIFNSPIELRSFTEVILCLQFHYSERTFSRML